MIFLGKNKMKISFLLLVSLPVFFFTNVSFARADTFSDLTSGVATFVQFVAEAFSGIKNDICAQVGANPDPFEASFCSGYVAPAPTVTADQSATSSSSNSSLFSIFGAFAPNTSLDVFSNTPNNASIASTSDDSITLQTPATTTQPAALPAGLSGTTTANDVNLDDSEILYWTNIARADNGSLKPLNENSILDKIAQIRVEDMFAKQYFSHYSPTGDNVSLEANANGYQYITIGENIAEGDFGTSRDLVTAWMNSPDHRANILNTSYQEIGVAAEEGEYDGNEVWISSQVFGEPLSACPSPDATLKNEITDDQAQATSLTTELASAKAQVADDSSNTSAYNTDAAAYNNLANEYNSLVAEMKTLVNQYNQQVAAFNACIQ